MANFPRISANHGQSEKRQHVCVPKWSPILKGFIMRKKYFHLQFQILERKKGVHLQIYPLEKQNSTEILKKGVFLIKNKKVQKVFFSEK